MAPAEAPPAAPRRAARPKAAHHAPALDRHVRRRARDTSPATPSGRNSRSIASRVVLIVRRLSSRNATIARASGSGCSRGDDRHVAAEDVVELEPAGVVGRDDRRAAGERLDRDRRQRLEERRQHEEIGGGAVARDDGIIDEPGKRDVTFDAGRSRRRLQLVEQRAGAADDQPRVRMRADDLVHRLDQEPLARRAGAAA